jgi:hypothetical protein
MMGGRKRYFMLRVREISSAAREKEKTRCG